jgi:hypothetical protein
LFSTITLWPRFLPSGSEMTRPTMSVVPPGAKGTVSLILLVGIALRESGGGQRGQHARRGGDPGTAIHSISP